MKTWWKNNYQQITFFIACVVALCLVICIGCCKCPQVPKSIPVEQGKKQVISISEERKNLKKEILAKQAYSNILIAKNRIRKQPKSDQKSPVKDSIVTNSDPICDSTVNALIEVNQLLVSDNSLCDHVNTVQGRIITTLESERDSVIRKNMELESINGQLTEKIDKQDRQISRLKKQRNRAFIAAGILAAERVARFAIREIRN